MTPAEFREEVAAFAQAMREAYGAELWLSVKADGDRHEPAIVSMESIVMPQRGTGQGTALMGELISWANRQGVILSLHPSSDFGGSVARLRKFYRRFGFVPNKGRNKDFRTRDAMIRYPRKLNPAAAADLEDPELTLAQVEADPKLLADIEADDPLHLPSARLAREAGFEVRARPVGFKGEFWGVTWLVKVPPDVERQLHGLVWSDRDMPMSFTLTRSTRHPGWQLTSWARDGGPWGHREIYGSASDAFDADPMASGQSLRGLAQVVFRDGRVLVREGAQRVAFNPDHQRLKRRLMR